MYHIPLIQSYEYLVILHITHPFIGVTYYIFLSLICTISHGIPLSYEYDTWNFHWSYKYGVTRGTRPKILEVTYDTPISLPKIQQVSKQQDSLPWLTCASTVGEENWNRTETLSSAGTWAGQKLERELRWEHKRSRRREHVGESSLSWGTRDTVVHCQLHGCYEEDGRRPMHLSNLCAARPNVVAQLMCLQKAGVDCQCTPDFLYFKKPSLSPAILCKNNNN